MNFPTISAYLWKHHFDKSGKCAVKIRVTFQRTVKYYPTGISLTPDDFKRAMTAIRKTEEARHNYNRIHAFESKAIKAAEALPAFTFNQFENLYLQNRDAVNSVSYAFDQYVNDLKAQSRIGTAVAYETAKNSLNEFKEGLKFADITPQLLRKYESWMLSQGKSKTTVGIYLRALRTIYNAANLDKSLYPFGDGKGRYSIPTGRNVKKALTLDEVSQIFHYQPEPGTIEEMARDYWVFIYLCNGMNVKDLCLLKRKNVKGDKITFVRAKTSRSKKESSEIVVSLKPEAKAIILKWGQVNLDPEAYLFPHLNKNMTPERQREVYQQVTKNINKYMKKIAEKLEINKDVTTYYARHSFATILKRTGASVEMIGELLGHSDTKTTRSYLAGFETEAIHKATDALTAFKKQG